MNTLKILLVLFFITFKVIAQSNVEINGEITKTNDQKLVGATLSFTIQDQLFYTNTDSVGKYKISIPTGVADVEISHIGFVSKKIKIKITQSAVFNFILEEDYISLNEVTIANQTKKTLLKLSENKITFSPKNMANIPSLMGTTDIIKLLQLMPGVQNSGDANGYLYVRGGDPGHNLMLYADTPVYGMAHLLGIFPFYNASHINEIQFDKSNINPKYGGRLSSTVLAIPNKIVPEKISIEGNLGLLASQATLAIPLNKKTGFYISGRKTYIDEIIKPLFTSEKQKGNDVDDLKYSFSDGNFTFISEINNRNSLTVDAFLSSDSFQIKDSNLTLSTDLKWSNAVLNTAWKCQLSEKTQLTNSVHFTRYSNTLQMNQAAVEMNASSSVQDFGYTNSIIYSIKNIPFESGLHYTSHNVQPQKIEISNLGIDDVIKQSTQIKANNAVVYTGLKPKLSDKLFAELGLRFNYYNAGANFKSLFKMEPRIALNYFYSQKKSFHISYSRQNQFLNLITTSSVGIPTDFWVAASEGIPSQTADQFALAYNQSFNKGTSASLGSFYRVMSNVIEYPYSLTQFNQITSFKNDILVGKGKSYGLECMLKHENEKFKGWISYTLSWSIRQFDQLNNGEPFYAKYDRRHNLSLVGTYSLGKKWNVGLTQIFSSGNRFTLPTSWYFLNNNPIKEYSQYNNSQMPNYIRTDISVNYWLTKTAKRESALVFSVYNTFNIENPVYLVLKVSSNENTNSIQVKTDKKTLYTLLPSISWRFKF